MKFHWMLSAILLCSSYSLCLAEDNTVPIKASGPEIQFGGSVKTKYEFTVPEQELVVPDTVDPGEVVIAKAGNITNPPPYLVAATYRWKVITSDGKAKTNVQEWPDGSSILFGSGAARRANSFTIVLAISYLYVVKEADKVVAIGQRSKLSSKVVRVSGGSPEPGPSPGPGPPDGKYGLASLVYKLAMDTVPVTSRTKGAAALSASFNGISSSVAAGTLTDPKDLLTQTQRANQSALRNVAVSPSDWDNFFTHLQSTLYQLSRTKKLNGVKDYAEAWQEIAGALDQVR